MMSLIPLPYKIGAALALAFLIAITSYFKGVRDESARFAIYKAEVSLVNAQIAADNERKLRLSDQVAAEVKSELADALANLRKRPAVRVLQSKCDTGAGQAVSAPPGVSLATPTADAVDTGIVLAAEECAEKLGDGIEDATKYAWLQHWVNQQHEASK